MVRKACVEEVLKQRPMLTIQKPGKGLDFSVEEPEEHDWQD